MDFSKAGECKNCGRLAELNGFDFCEECEKEYEEEYEERRRALRGTRS